MHALLRSPKRWSGPRLREGVSNGVHPVRPGRGAARTGPQARQAAPRARHVGGVLVRRGSHGPPADATIATLPDWHGIVAWDLLLNNLTTGLFLVAALTELAASQRFASVARVAYPVALVFLLIDLACLILDLGNPLRFHHML